MGRAQPFPLPNSAANPAFIEEALAHLEKEGIHLERAWELANGVVLAQADRPKPMLICCFATSIWRYQQTDSPTSPRLARIQGNVGQWNGHDYAPPVTSVLWGAHLFRKSLIALAGPKAKDDLWHQGHLELSLTPPQ